MRAARMALLLVAVAAGGCGKKSDNGYAVALTVIVDPSISDVDLARVTRMKLTVTGADTFSHTFDVTDELKTREGRVLYRPGAQSGKLDFAVTLGDGNVEVGSGTVGDVTLVAGSTTTATVHVGQSGVVLDMSTLPDMTVDQTVPSDGTVLADLFGVDLTGADLKPPPDLVVLPDLVGADLANADLKPPPADLVVVPDLTPVVDLTSLPDFRPPPDLTVLPLFAAPVRAKTGNGPVPIAVADFNLDGRIDIVTANTTGNSVGVILNTTSGFDSQPVDTVDNEPTSIAAGVFGSIDNRPDVVVGCAGLPLIGNPTLTFLQGDGAGGFGSSNSRPTADTPYNIAVGPFDASTPRPAFMVVQGNDIELYSITTSSLLRRSGFTLSQSAHAVVGANLNGDGLIDVVMGGMSTMLGTPLVGYSQPVNTAISPNTPSLVTADFDKDGMPDFAFLDVAADTLYVEVQSSVTPLAFNQTTKTSTAKGTFGMATGDFNGDGAVDIAITHSTTNEVGIYLNNGAARLTLGPTFVACGGTTLNPTPMGIVAADFNGDSRPDLAITCRASNEVNILFHN